MILLLPKAEMCVLAAGSAAIIVEGPLKDPRYEGQTTFAVPETKWDSLANVILMSPQVTAGQPRFL